MSAVGLTAMIRSHLAERYPDGLLVAAARRPWRSLAVLVGAAVVVGAGVVVSGIVPLTASGGHWPITQWFLEFSMERSVATHSLGIDAPPLDDPARVVRGAAHYDLGCSPCHGAVRGITPRIARAMMPVPPVLPPVVPEWRDRELFYVVKHGVKFTGMPAWPATQRDDEVWAMVAFLRRLPSLDQQEYERLARAETPSALWDLPPGSPVSASGPAIVVGNCARCHGLDGRGRAEAFPHIGGQRTEYLDNSMRAYADGRRYSGIMGPIAASLSRTQREDAVKHYASQAWPGATTPPTISTTAARSTTAASEPADEIGAAIVLQGLASRDIPACVSCHGPSALAEYPAYPRLTGQPAFYVRDQLRLFQRRSRGGTEYAHLMHTFVDRLTAEEIEAVSTFLAALR